MAKRLNSKYVVLQLGVDEDLNTLSGCISKNKAFENYDVCLTAKALLAMRRSDGKNIQCRDLPGLICKEFGLKNRPRIVTKKYQPILQKIALQLGISGRFDKAEVLHVHGEYFAVHKLERVFPKLNPDLDGEYTFEFRKYVQDPETNSPPIKVSFIGRPGDVGQDSMRCKHLWVYNKATPYDISCTVNEFVKKYNSAKINDSNNWTNIPDGIQIFIIDQILRSCKIDLDSLKNLTSGNASNFAGNRKSFGDSYVPREDAQVIITSIQSPWSLYARYHSGNRRYVDEDVVAHFEGRFKVVRLDGKDDLPKYRHPRFLTDDQLFRRCCAIIDKAGKDGEANRMKSLLRMALKITYLLQAHKQDIFSGIDPHRKYFERLHRAKPGMMLGLRVDLSYALDKIFGPDGITVLNKRCQKKLYSELKSTPSLSATCEEKRPKKTLADHRCRR